MESTRKQHWQQLQSLFEPGFRRMLLVSLLLHLLVPILYHTPFFPKRQLEKPPVYRVNLVNKPVKNPQAGRPEAVPVEKPQPPEPVLEPPKAVPVKPETKPEPVAPPKPLPKPEPKPEPKPAPPKPEPKPAPKPEPKPAAKPLPEKAPAASKKAEDELQKRLEQMRAEAARNQAEADRKAKLDALRAAAAAESRKVKSPVTSAPVGSLTGKGTDVGVDERDYVREFITQQWRLSQYQLSTRDLEAEALLVYSAEGKLVNYKFVRKSGNEIFDSSLQRAILKSKDLGQPLQELTEFHVFFNLKEMLDRP